MLHAKCVAGGGGRAQRPCAPAALRQLPPTTLADQRHVHIRIATAPGVPDPGPIIAAPDAFERA
eukprot:11202530-Lingulodinium_polyedra.AAC.1